MRAEPPEIDMLKVLSENLAALLDRPGTPFRSPTDFARQAKVAPNTVSYLLDPSRKPTTTRKKQGYPTLDVLMRIAGKLGIPLWALVHPRTANAVRAAKLYGDIEQDWGLLQAVGSVPAGIAESVLRIETERLSPPAKSSSR